MSFFMFLMWFLACAVMGIMAFVSLFIVVCDLHDRDWTMTTAGISILSILFFICLFGLVTNPPCSDTENSRLHNVEDKYDEVVEELSRNPFDKKVLLEVLDINHEIDACNIIGDGDYFGMDPIDYRKIQTEYIFENYEDEIKEMYTDKYSKTSDNDSIIDKELASRALEKILKELKE